LHQLTHLIDFARARFARVPLRDIFEALVAEQCPSFEHFIHPVARRLQVGADRRIGPSLRVQIDNSAAALVRIGDLSIGWIAPPGRFSAFATATGHGAHLTKQNGLLVA